MDYSQLREITKDITVLYAEDEVLVADMVTNYFKLFFKDIVYVENGLLAYQEYKNNQDKYGLIILDIEMPKMDGLQVTSKIKEINDKQKVMLFTAYDDFEYIQKALSYGADEYLTKPLDEEEFITKVSELLGG